MGGAKKIALHLQEEGTGVQRILVGALANDVEVFLMQLACGFQIHARVPDHAVLGTVGQIEQVAGLIAGFDALAEPGRERCPVVAPVMNEHGVYIDNARPQAEVIKPFIDGQANLGVLIAQGGLVQLTTQKHAVGGIGKRRFRAVAPMQSQVNRF